MDGGSRVCLRVCRAIFWAFWNLWTLRESASCVFSASPVTSEQIRGAQDIDVRTDIYSCGVVLYELLVGKKPFDGDSAFSIMKAHTEQAPPSLIAANSQIPPALSEIVLRTLAKKPEARFQSADAFLQAIKGVQIEPADVRPARASTHRLFSRPILITVCAVLTILIGVLVAAVTARLGKAQPQTSKSVSVPPPAVAPAIPDTPAVATPPSASANVAPKKPQDNLPPPDKAALVEETVPKETGSDPIPASAPEAKTRNPVVKLGGILKRINPFQKNGSTPHNDDPKN